MKSISEELLYLGMDEDELDSHESDLYVLMNKTSTKWLSTYEHKNSVSTFTSDIDNRTWYDVPFGYMNEHIKSKGRD